MEQPGRWHDTRDWGGVWGLGVGERGASKQCEEATDAVSSCAFVLGGMPTKLISKFTIMKHLSAKISFHSFPSFFSYLSADIISAPGYSIILS